MQRIFSRAYALFENAPVTVMPYRWAIVALLLAISVFMGVGVQRYFLLDVSIDAWFEEEAPPFLIRNEFKHYFGSDENVYLVYRPSSGDVFSESAMKTLVDLHKELEQASRSREGLRSHLSHIVKIDSLYNARYQLADGDTLITKKLIGADFPATKSALETRRAIALTQDNFERMFFSDDFQYGGVQIKTDFGAEPAAAPIEEFAGPQNLLEEDDFGLGDDIALTVNSAAAPETVQFEKPGQNEYLLFMSALREITQQAKYKDFKFYFVGAPVNNEFMIDSIAQAADLVGLMVILFIAILWMLFGSFSAVVWPLLIVALSTLWATGVGCWMGTDFTAMWILTVMLILAIGTSSCVHVFSTYTLFKKEGKDHDEAIQLTYRKTAVPIFLTSATTMMGMAALTLSGIPTIEGFGLSSTIAVAFMFIFIIFLLPILLHYWHPPANTESRSRIAAFINIQPLLRWIAGFSHKHHRIVIGVYVVAFILLVIGTIELKLDSNDSKLIRPSNPIRIAQELVDDKMMGGMSLEVLMKFEKADAFKDAEVLKQISAWQDHIAKNYSDTVIKTFSVADIVKDTNKVMHNDDPAFDRIPDDTRLASQLLYLFNNSNAKDRRELVSDDYSTSHITFLMRNEGTSEYLPFLDNLNKDISTYFDPLKAKYPGMDIKITGTFKLMMVLNDELTRTQLASFGSALLIISLVLMIALGSVQAGMIAIVPNLLPAFFTFGIMGLLGVPLDGKTLIIAPVIIGIAVDDTIHFLSHYRHCWLKYGEVNLAMAETLKEVGQAVVFTSVILGFGFGVLSFAEFLGLAKPGFFGAMAIFVALLSTLFLLPALLFWLKPNMGRDKVQAEAAIVQ